MRRIYFIAVNSTLCIHPVTSLFSPPFPWTLFPGLQHFMNDVYAYPIADPHPVSTPHWFRSSNLLLGPPQNSGGQPGYFSPLATLPPVMIVLPQFVCLRFFLTARSIAPENLTQRFMVPSPCPFVPPIVFSPPPFCERRFPPWFPLRVKWGDSRVLICCTPLVFPPFPHFSLLNPLRDDF